MFKLNFKKKFQTYVLFLKYKKCKKMKVDKDSLSLEVIYYIRTKLIFFNEIMIKIKRRHFLMNIICPEKF